MCRTCTFDMEITCDMEREKLSDEQGIMGAGRLTDKAINTLQNYYGMAIRNNVGDLYGMKKSVRPTLFHNCDIANAEEKHQFCPHLRTSCLCGGPIKLLLAKINIERNYLYHLPLDLC